MVMAAKDLPESIDALKQMVSAKEQMLLAKDQRIAVLEEQLKLLTHKRFGASSEKASPDQLHLFNEAEATFEQSSETVAADADEATVPEHKRKKPGCRPLPADLPRVIVEHDLAEDQKTCPCGCHQKRIDQETSEQLDIIPPKAQVLQHVRYCLAHARRKFDGALKAQKQKDRGGLAKQGLELIQRIYHVERDARTRQVDADQRKTLRDEKAKPVWNELRIWLDQARGRVPPKSLTGKALGDLDKQWPRLIRVLDDGRIEVDNNGCENAIRPFVMPDSFCTPFSSV